ncbi:histone-lysine N-methyltransferase SETMAR [Caerostris extrusa]|uniref:Histone-lysine N-methyltransferase SETMAR n=1 Tax=Caerostris extrusa TaxID=172846 RepID=A0AAV4NIZ8_CAEEX|nr:histone-lysine N-methyltransferase SETMAR [Caerostris extrusa]
MVSFFSIRQTGCQKPQYDRSCRVSSSTRHELKKIQNDRREISPELGLSFVSVQHMVSDVLRYSKVCTHWVPRALSDEHKATRMMCSLTFLQCYHSDGQHFIDHIVAGDES